MSNFEETVAKLETMIPESGEWGLVLYTDGGFRKETNVSSWGLHGYMYDYVDRKAGYGLKKCAPTNTGYVGPGIRIVDEDDKPLRRSFKNRLDVVNVRIAAYIDGYEPLIGGTNNQAEVLGLLNALKLIEALSPPQTQLVLDSEYALKGALLWNPKWKEKNYIKNDGSEVPNKEIWAEVAQVIERIEAKKIKVAWDWVKGHRDDVGNNTADLTSNQAMNAAINNETGIRFTISEVAKYWSPAVTIHPLLREPRLYLPVNLVNRPIKEGQVYYFGNVGPADDVEGQPSADRGYSVVHLAEPDPVLSITEDYFRKACLTNHDIFIIRLRNDMITKAKMYAEILEHGSIFFEPKPENQVIKNVHTRKSEKGFGEAIDPPELSSKLLENLLRLEELLSIVRGGGHDTIVSHEISDLFYGVEQKKNKEVVKYQASNKAFIRSEIKYVHEDRECVRAIPLTYGIDLPSQSTLRALVNFNPKLHLIHWQENNLWRRYATVLETDVGCGLWCGIYSNKSFLVNER